MASDAMMNDNEWKLKLAPERYRILREKETERPFTGKLLHNKKKGVYLCAGCGQELFLSDSKFDSGSGWPSFYEAMDDDRIRTEIDNSFGMRRVEILCSRCGGHLGHLFNDGPFPTGLRYCVNSLSLEFSRNE
jgi:peptide-methionine (R)-S-oxide reductase